MTLLFQENFPYLNKLEKWWTAEFKCHFKDCWDAAIYSELSIAKSFWRDIKIDDLRVIVSVDAEEVNVYEHSHAEWLSLLRVYRRSELVRIIDTEDLILPPSPDAFISDAFICQVPCKDRDGNKYLVRFENNSPAVLTPSLW